MSLETILLSLALTALGAMVIRRLDRIELSVDRLRDRVDAYLPPLPHS